MVCGPKYLQYKDRLYYERKETECWKDNGNAVKEMVLPGQPWCVIYSISLLLFLISPPIFQLPRESPFFHPSVHATHDYLLICNHGTAWHTTEKYPHVHPQLKRIICQRHFFDTKDIFPKKFISVFCLCGDKEDENIAMSIHASQMSCGNWTLQNHSMAETESNLCRSSSPTPAQSRVI